MKHKFALGILLLTLLTFSLHAEANNLGLGIILGEPTGLSGKMYLSGNTAIDAAASWSFRNDNFYFHADYLRHFPGLLGRDLEPLTPYAGLGGLLYVHEDPMLGVRFPLGLSLFIPDTQFEVFLELGPGLLLIPETDFDFTGGIGARYYF